MTAGRPPNDPLDEQAAGYPGRRKSKTDKKIDAMTAAAASDAKLFAGAGEGAALDDLPIFLADPRLAAAQTIWREYAPRLAALHMLSTLDRYTFAMFCLYAAEFVLANRDILDKGYSILVTTVAGAASGKAGSQMPRLNPSVDRRDFAAKMMLVLSEKFGLTASDRARLISQHAMQADEQTLFGRTLPTPAPADDQAPAPAAAAPATLIGALGSHDGPPPPRDRHN